MLDEVIARMNMTSDPTVIDGFLEAIHPNKVLFFLFSFLFFLFSLFSFLFSLFSFLSSLFSSLSFLTLPLQLPAPGQLFCVKVPSPWRKVFFLFPFFCSPLLFSSSLPSPSPLLTLPSFPFLKKENFGFMEIYKA